MVVTTLSDESVEVDFVPDHTHSTSIGRCSLTREERATIAGLFNYELLYSSRYTFRGIIIIQ